MATYLYGCRNKKCNHQLEIKHSMLEEPDVLCPLCLTSKCDKILDPVHTGISSKHWDGADWENTKNRPRWCGE